MMNKIKQQMNSYLRRSKIHATRMLAMVCLTTLLGVSQTFASHTEAVFASMAQQTASIRTGVVLEASNGLPLPGVSVVIKGTASGTATDMDGKFSIRANEGDILVISFIGMKSVSHKVEGSKSINVSLLPDSEQVDEIMVVAYGVVKKSSFTGSAQVVKKDVLMKTSSSSIASALVGRVAGVSVANSNSAAGSTPKIRVRGFGSFSAGSEPLYVVDGVANAPIPSNDDVETLTILKDAAASSLYGSRAANGVVIITTKKGKGGIKFNVKYSKSLAWKSPDNLKMMGTDGYTKQAWQGLYNHKRYIEGKESEATQYAHDEFVKTIGGQNPYAVKNADGTFSPMAQPFDNKGNLKSDAIKMIDTDWLDEVYRLGKTNNFHMSVSKGDDNGSIYTSISYFDQEAIVLANNYKKFNAVLNIETKVNDIFTYGFNSNLTYSEGRELNKSFLSDAYKYNPTMTKYQLDDNYNFILDSNGNKKFNWDNPISKNHNAFAESEINTDGYDSKGFFASPYIRLMPITNFVISIKGSANLESGKSNFFMNPLNGPGKDKNGRSYKKYWDSRNLYGLIMGNYTKSLGDHTLSAKLGYEVEDYVYTEANASAKSFKLWNDQRELQAGEKPDKVNSYTHENSKLSYISELKYDYLNKYYFSTSFRRDGSSKFGPDNRWGDFWSVGATWRLSEEEFVKNLTFVQSFKIRASYGVNGNDQIGNYKYHGLYSSNETYNNKMGILYDKFENNNLGWESNTNFTIAAEFSLFKKLQGTIEYYSRISSDLLLEKYYPVSSGAGSRFENIGEVSNTGYEIALNYQVFSDDLKWNTGITLSHNENEITKLVGGAEYWDGQNLRKEGGSIQNLAMREWSGVDPTTGAPLWSVRNDQDGVITYDTTSDWSGGSMFDKGDPSPKVFGSWTNELQYKNFDFSFMFYYSFGGHAYNDLAGLTHNDGAMPLWNLAEDASDSWSATNTNAQNPRFTNSDASKAWYRSSRFYESLDYVKLKNVTLAYSFDKSVTSRLGLSRLRLFVMGENLLTFTDFKGYDPELDFDGTTGTSIIPPATSITFGVNISF